MLATAGQVGAGQAGAGPGPSERIRPHAAPLAMVTRNLALPCIRLPAKLTRPRFWSTMKCASSARSRRLLLTPSAAAADVESPGEPTEQQLQTNRLLMRADFGGLLDAVEAGASNFSAVNASTALIQLARGAGGSKGLSSDPAARAAVAAMADHLVQNAGSYGERALASSFHSLARMGQASNEVLAAVGEQVVSRPSGGISAQALDTIAWAWVWAGCGSDASLSDRVLGVVAAEASARASAFAPKGLANVSWALSKAGTNVEGSRKAMDAVARESVPRIKSFMASELSSLVGSFARAGVKAPELFKAAAGQLKNRAPDLRPHELAITVWAYSKAQERPPPSMLEAVGRQAAKKAAFFGPNELAIAAWGFAAMTCRPPPEVFPAFSREVSRLVGEMSGQNVANTAWAFAKARHYDSALFGRLASQLAAKNRDDTLSVGEISMAMYALAETGHQSPVLFREFGRKLTARAGELSTGEQAMVLRSCAKARRSPDGLFDELGKRIAVVWTSARTQELSMAAWALAKASHRSPDVYEALADAFLIRAQEFSPKELANVLWALAKMGCSKLPAVCAAAEEELGRRKDDFGPVDIRMTCNAFRAAGHKLPSTCNELRAEDARGRKKQARQRKGPARS